MLTRYSTVGVLRVTHAATADGHTQRLWIGSSTPSRWNATRPQLWTVASPRASFPGPGAPAWRRVLLWRTWEEPCINSWCALLTQHRHLSLTGAVLCRIQSWRREEKYCLGNAVGATCPGRAWISRRKCRLRLQWVLCVRRLTERVSRRLWSGQYSFPTHAAQPLLPCWDRGCAHGVARGGI